MIGLRSGGRPGEEKKPVMHALFSRTLAAQHADAQDNQLRKTGETSGVGVRCAFLLDQTLKPVRPECPPWRAYRGASTSLPFVILSAAKDLASPSHLKPRGVRWRACLDPPDALTKFFACGELLLATAPKVTKKAAPDVCASRPRRGFQTGHPWPV